MKKKTFSILIFFALLFFISSILAKPTAEYLYHKYEVPSDTEALYGDAGEEIFMEDASEIVLSGNAEPTTWAFVELALEYNGKIPFADGGRYWQAGYPVFDTGIDNRTQPVDCRMGMDSLGYVQWLYRNIFGTYEELLDTPNIDYPSYAVKSNELQVGDIGMISLENTKNHFGVCIGHYNGIAVFSHCDSTPTALYPGGTTRLSYLKEHSDDYLNGSAPVAFRYFVRPAVHWETTEVENE